MTDSVSVAVVYSSAILLLWPGLKNKKEKTKSEIVNKCKGDWLTEKKEAFHLLWQCSQHIERQNLRCYFQQILAKIVINTFDITNM